MILIRRIRSKEIISAALRGAMEQLRAFWARMGVWENPECLGVWWHSKLCLLDICGLGSQQGPGLCLGNTKQLWGCLCWRPLSERLLRYLWLRVTASNGGTVPAGGHSQEGSSPRVATLNITEMSTLRKKHSKWKKALNKKLKKQTCFLNFATWEKMLNIINVFKD